MSRHPDAKASKKTTKSFWVCWRPKDALDGMSQLTPIEELAYRRILDMIFATDDRLLDDDKTLGWSTRAGRQWKAVKAGLILKGKIAVVDGFIRNAKATETCIETRAFRAQKSAAAAASHQSPKRLINKNNGSAHADAVARTDAEPYADASHQLPSEGLRPSAGKPGGGGRGRGKPKQSDLGLGAGQPSGAAADAPVPNGSGDAKALFDDGLPKLNAMVGGDNRSLIAKWIKVHPFGAKRIHALIREAHRLFTTPGEALADPKAWICDALAPKHVGHDGLVPEEANGWPVYEVAAYCRGQAKVPRDHWPGLEKVVYRALLAELDPERDLYPIMRSMLTRNPDTTGLGFIVTAFRERVDGYAALRKAELGRAA